MATQLVYLDDFEVATCFATVISVEKTEDSRLDVQLDRSCFYPRGGGQDWDIGTITGAEEGVGFEVQEVRLDAEGTVHHIGSYRSGAFETGERVACHVDIERRTINTRLHSAGHVIDMAIDQLGLTWKPVRGGHYPHMSFVEYEADISPEEAESLTGQIEQKANEAITAGSQNEIRFMPVSEMHTVCRNVPDNIPANKPARVVVYNGNFGVPCGGTHVKNIREVGRLAVTKIKSKKGVTKVSYAVEGIN